jgi:hypothetical protein
MSNLDTAVLIGAESTYGTAATLTRAYEAQVDSFKRVQEPIESKGFRAGLEAMRSDRFVQVNKGGTGSLELDVSVVGAGLLLDGLLGAAVAPTQIAATAAYKQTFTTTSAGPSESYTLQVIRGTVGGTQKFTHTGGMFTGFNLSQDVDAFLKLGLDFDFDNVETSTAAGTATYVADDSALFDWTQCVATINGTATDVRSLSVSGDLGMATDRYRLKGAATKSQPVRTAVPTFTGAVELDFTDNTVYDLWVAGTVVPIIFTWTGANIEDANNYELKITMAACRLDGESPVAQVEGDIPSQSVPFSVLHNGTDDALMVEYTSIDTAV